tara:strand:- start:1471 stop:2358 length:888 start_codon:yes stop_codon:yes gene_type:complete
MKIISFDVGIKNMAYCILDLSGEKIDITDWNVLNLLNLQTFVQKKCTVKCKTSKKKNEEKVCGKNAKYQKGENFYCEQHAKCDKQYMMPKKDYTEKVLKKKKIEDLLSIGKQHMFFLDNVKRNKQELIDTLRTYFNKHMLDKIEKEKKVTAGETDLLSIGKNLKIELNKLDTLDNIDVVFIENQISPIANRMKTIQGMLAQYFIMTTDNISIEFVSSSHKLKQFDKDKNSYKENKQQSVIFSKNIIDKNENFENWKEKLDSKKKDDLADCFLQGLYYFVREKNIYYADDLKIKFV